MVNDIDHLLKQWGAWNRDTGNWRGSCCSIEKRFIFDKSRYWCHAPNQGETMSDDEIKYNARVNYDISVAEKIESIVVKMNENLKIAIILSYVYFPHFETKKIARLLKISNSSFQNNLDLAIFFVRRNYHDA